MIPNGLLISLYRQDLFFLWGLALQSLDICREQIEVYVAGLGFNPYKYVPHENAVFSAAS